MAYEIPTPPTLDALDETAPLGSEDAALIDDALRQTRNLLKNTFLVEHNADGSHKGGAILQADPNSVTGTQIQSSATDDSKRAIGTNHLKDLSVTTPKIADGAATAVKLAVDSVETAKIKDLNVTSAKLNDLAVTTAKLAGNAVDSTKLKSDAAVDANRAVTTDHLRDSSVASAKIAAGAVSPDKISDIGLSKLLVGNGAGAAVAAAIGGDATATLTGGVLEIALNSATSIAFAKVVEGASSTLLSSLPDTASDTDAWTTRPFHATQAWSLEQTHTGMVSITSKRITLKAGAYWIRFGSYVNVSPVNNQHQCKIRNITSGADLLYSPAVEMGIWANGFGVFQLTVDSELELQARSTSGNLSNTTICLAPTRGGAYGSFWEIMRVSLEGA